MTMTLKPDSKPPGAPGTKDPLPFPHFVIGRSLQSKEKLESDTALFRRNSGFKDLPVHGDKIHCLAWSKDGKLLATGSYDKTVVLWSCRDGKLSREYSLKGHDHSVDQLAWHPVNFDQLLSSSADKTIKIWAVKQRVALHTLEVRGEAINVCWAPDGESFVVGDKEDTLTFLQVETGLRMEKKSAYEVNEMVFRQVGEGENRKTYLFLAGGSSDGHGSLEYFDYNFPNLNPIGNLVVSGQFCVAVEMDPLRKYFAVGGNDSNITLWNIDGLYPMQEITRHKTVVRSLSFSYDGRFLASTTGEDGYIDVALVETGEKIWSYHSDEREKESMSLVALAFHPKQNFLACAYDIKDRHKESSMVRIFGFPTVEKKEVKQETRARSREREREREKDASSKKDEPKPKEEKKPKFESKFSFLTPTAEQLAGLEERKAAHALREAKLLEAKKVKEQALAAAKVSTKMVSRMGISDQPSRSGIRQQIRAPDEKGKIVSSVSVPSSNSVPKSSSASSTMTTAKKTEERPSSSTTKPASSQSSSSTKKEGSRSRPSSGSRKSDPEDSGPDRKKRRSAAREMEKSTRSSSTSARSDSKK